MVEIEKHALIQILGINANKKNGGIVTSLLNITTRVTYEIYATRFPDAVVVLILRVR